MNPESSKISFPSTSLSPLLSETASAHDSALKSSLSESHQDESDTDAAPNTQSIENDHRQEEEVFDDYDSAFGGSLIGCDTKTLATYITDYRYENGRRYHAYQDGEYWGPNDEPSSDSQDLAHHMYLMTLDGKLHLAPLQDPQNILDVGTGRDLGNTYPKGHFDFIHIRELFGCVIDWDVFFLETLSCLKPGGYVEILEHSVCPVSDDDTVNEKSFFTEWGKTVIGLEQKFGESSTIWNESIARIEAAGSADVVEVRYKWPMNPWPSPEHRTHGNDGDKRWEVLKESGRWNQYRVHEGIEGYMIRLLTGVNGWTYEATQLFLAEMRKELKDENIHAILMLPLCMVVDQEVNRDRPMPLFLCHSQKPSKSYTMQYGAKTFHMCRGYPKHNAVYVQ
ncbi:hypothetical protein OCU04_003971 [Sclerotinia nivalis]|uniref:S-adenosyl-L-methionine-dependent methyltransferase n=1 Tax=Sclerotinia nivalis TaxID=352851 RepID=A0A9X0AT02_9HELO|nr:hypothetical protein OCU04_003971 [Sclerotinia nivalis]